jgi:hypothetical protein
MIHDRARGHHRGLSLPHPDRARHYLTTMLRLLDSDSSPGPGGCLSREDRLRLDAEAHELVELFVLEYPNFVAIYDERGAACGLAKRPAPGAPRDAGEGD